ncbi:MAG: hypothetical protein ABIL25_09040 [candidate division WOR-3 bacterium]
MTLFLVLVLATIPNVGPDGNVDFGITGRQQAVSDSPPGWSADTLLSLNDGKESRDPVLTIDTRGRLHAAWKDNRRLRGSDEIHYRCRDSSGWSEIFAVGNLDTAHNSPGIAVGPDNSVHLCFLRWYGVPYAYYDLGYRRRDGLTGNWDDEEWLTVDDSLGFAAYPQTAVASDSVFVFWQKERSNPAEIWYRYNKGTGWSDRVAVVTGEARPNGYYAVVSTRDGWVHIVWQDNRDGTNQLWHRYSQGDTWSVPELVTNHGYACTQPSIATDSADNLHLAYSGGQPEGRIHYRVWTRATRQWQAPTRFYSWSGSPMPKVAVNHATGERHMTHVGYTIGWCLAYKHYDPLGQVWDTTQLTFNYVNTGAAPLVIDPEGFVHLVFWDQRFGEEEIQYKTNRIQTGLAAGKAASSRNPLLIRPSVFRSGGLLQSRQRTALYDASGRKAAVLVPGANLVTVQPGVYFARTADGAEQKVISVHY